MAEEDVIVYSEGIVFTSVCTTLGDEETVEWMNAHHGTGISSAWAKADEPFATGQPNGVACNKDASRRHLLLVC